MEELIVDMVREEDKIFLKLGHIPFNLIFEPSGNVSPNPDYADFAAWVCLPIAMQLGQDLKIIGKGSVDTEKNARRLSKIWETWMPDRFREISVSFTNNDIEEKAPDYPHELMLFSGGVDSTYCLQKRINQGQTQSLLTIHGLDYQIQDEERFNALLDKTDTFSKLGSDLRLTLRTNAYQVYNKFGLTPDITHGFVLATCLFLYSRRFANGLIAADDSIEQQFMVWPWGTNFLTNGCFDSGYFKVITECEDVTRCYKVGEIKKYKEALSSLTFCVDYKSRPNNCGLCQKCIRTKVMFIASTGEIPDIFLDNALPEKCMDVFDIKNRYQRMHLYSIYVLARKNGYLSRIPSLERIFRKSASPGLFKRISTKLIQSRFAPYFKFLAPFVK